MKKLVCMMLCSVMAFSLVACGDKDAKAEKESTAAAEVTETLAAENDSADDEQVESTDAETVESTDAESNNSGDEVDPDDGDASDKTGVDEGKEYTAEKLAKAFPINNVKMEEITSAGTVEVIIKDKTLKISTESDGYKIEMYLVDNVEYMHISGGGQDQWMKDSDAKEDIEGMFDEFQNLAVADAMTNVEYVETTTENGVTYDVVKATEVRDGEEYQELMFYINTKTGLTERTEGVVDGEEVVVYYSPSDGFELPAEALKAAEM